VWASINPLAHPPSLSYGATGARGSVGKSIRAEPHASGATISVLIKISENIEQ
jgi:hypothetical protein